jgi:hypothetical protein
MRIFAAFACTVLLICLGIVPGHAEKRVALVIGNGAYSKVPQLINPSNDATAMAALLRDAGFDVVQAKTNLDLTSLRRALRDFIDNVRDADVAVVFYAGHGVEVNGTNYLIPVDAVLERDIDVEDETVSLDRLNQYIEPAKRLRVVILDACRDNPFTSKMKRTLGNRSIGRGLGRVDVLTADTMVAFAAKAGSTASDGVGPNSPYTSALLQHLVTPGLDVRIALGRVRDQVLSSTGGKQEPFVYGSLGGGEISLAPKVTMEPASSAVTPPVGEAGQGAWSMVQNSSDIRVLEAFVKRYGDTFYGDLARMRIEDLKKAPAVAAPPPEQRPAPAQPQQQIASAPPPAPVEPTELRRTLSVDDVLRDKGIWVSRFNVKSDSAQAPEIFNHYFILADPDYATKLVSPGTIVTGHDWDRSDLPWFRVVQGSVASASGDNKYPLYFQYMTYLGPKWRPEFAKLSDAVFKRLNGKVLANKVTHP